MTELEKIYKAYFNDVYLFILSLCKNEEIAEDITAETFFKALTSMDNFQGKCEIRTWLCQIAKNCYFTYLRKNKKLDNNTQLEKIRDDVDIELSLLHSDTAMEIHKVLHQLDEPYKEVFTLRVFGELSFKQIGYLFEKTENWACVTYHRARKKIIIEMEDKK